MYKFKIIVLNRNVTAVTTVTKVLNWIIKL